MTIDKPICAKDEVHYCIKKAGVMVVFMFLDPPQPYRIWPCDSWECPKCRHVVLVGFSNKPLAEHDEEKFGRFFEEVKDNCIFIYGSSPIGVDEGGLKK